MPIIRQLQDDEERRKRMQGQPTMAGAVGPSAPAAPAQQALGGPSGPTSVQGSNHINIQDYLKANEGQGNKMADKIGIESQAAGVRGAQPVQNQYVQGLASAPRPQNAATGPAGLSSKTPTYLEGQAETDAAAAVSRKAGLAGTSGGQKELLDQAYGSGRSSGESDFDNALMGGTGGGSRLGDLNKKYAGLSSWVQADQAGTAARATERASALDDHKRINDAQWASFNKRGYGSENVDNGPNNVGLDTGPNAVNPQNWGRYSNSLDPAISLDHRPSYSEWLAMGKGPLNRGAGEYWQNNMAHQGGDGGISEDIFSQMTDAEVMEMMNIASAGGTTKTDNAESDKGKDEFTARMKAKYGKKA